MSEVLLPPGFEELQPFVPEWALVAEKDRYGRRLSMTLDQLHVFYGAILPRMSDIMRHLAQFPADNIATVPASVRNLYHLALSYMEASHPIELRWKGADLEDAFPAYRIIYQNPSDVN
jgi:hypothetical protein